MFNPAGLVLGRNDKRDLLRIEDLANYLSVSISIVEVGKNETSDVLFRRTGSTSKDTL